ncbi:sigma-70 family RNA polymerase sigma factor [Jiangella alkaliphila]|uniref:RNA polymerase sigma-70 factor, ECF subfamily n=1 Tax=Jiangella alkaliphila TaxID=419479 RepID=A0A1H2KJ27_9ACTN|nr:sigma-70 family RNA polymerase sigma factor [Jiangella alkaliphila]SDU68592.1 RNA polymerase sigma-70 factor, ECF subfamily [Jiangella alkaliphila]
MDTQLLEAGRDLDRATSIFMGQRPRLFTIAYRVLGSAPEAEDVVQEAWIRWQRTDRTVVLDHGAFLSTTVVRLAINVRQSARRRHELDVGPELPEPPESPDDRNGPDVQAERREAVELAVQLLMERLTPAERAAYVLREGFAYPYRRISDVLQLRVAHARQLVRRARQRLSSGRTAPVDPAGRRRLVEAFLAAARAGDLTVLEGVLVSEAAVESGRRDAPRVSRPAPLPGRTR